MKQRCPRCGWDHWQPACPRCSDTREFDTSMTLDDSIHEVMAGWTFASGTGLVTGMRTFERTNAFDRNKHPRRYPKENAA